jgi:SNF2 family DNA or RNA helicase
VADECHKMKNPESEQGEQFLSTRAETMIALTGTPIMNNPLDLYIILKWLGYEEHSFYQYKVHYCRMGGYGGYEIIGFKHLDQIQDILDKMMLRRLKSDVLDLPEKIYITEYVEMSTKQTKIYNEIRNELLCNVDLIAASVNPLSELIRLRQATGYTGILSSTIKESAKLDRLEELVSDIIENGQKVIIFSNWITMTDAITERLSAYKPNCITGKTPEQLRNDYVDAFQTNQSSNILIGTIGAMGTGLTLTAATNVIFLDEPWNRAIRDQAEDRAHRIGTILPINIYFLITKNTIDEKIHNLVEAKGKISDAVIDNKIDVNTLNYLLS